VSLSTSPTTKPTPAAAPAAPTPPRGRRAKSYVPSDADRPGRLGYLLLAAVVAASVFPLYYSLVLSTHDNSAIGSAFPPMVPGGHLLANIHRVFDTVDFWLAMRNSLTVATTTAFANVLLGSLAGFAFARLRFRGRNALFMVVIITSMVPAQLGVIPLYLLMSDLAWTDTLKAVVVPALIGAFAVFWMRQAAEESIPYELIEAARVDGCSVLRTYWHVALPAIRSQAAVLGMFSFMGAWNDFFWPLIVLDPSNTPTVQVALSSLASGYGIDYTLVITGATLGLLPLLAVFVLLSRQIVGGIMAGAVKA
jgi:cellobiose transport system permease protein